jgi:hypothetical protein
MTVTIREVYMYHRLPPRAFSSRLLHLSTFTGIAVLIATAWWAATQVRPRHDAVAESRGIGIEKSTTGTGAASVEIATVTPSQASELVPEAPVSAQNGILSQPAAERAAPVRPRQARRIRAVSPTARAEMRPARERNAERGATLEPVIMSPEKSFTGAGRAFDAVH